MLGQLTVKAANLKYEENDRKLKEIHQQHK